MLNPMKLAATLAASFTINVSPASATEPEPHQISQEMLDALVEVSGVPGFGAAVWSDGQIAWAGSAGQRDLERGLPVDANTRFRLASVSKLLAVTAAAKLAEEGHLDLDAPVKRLLPWLGNRWEPISLRQLAAHASGLPHYQDIDAGRGHSHFANGREAVGNFSNRQLLYAPGSRYSYSSWGYTLIGAVIEEVSGQSFPDFVSARIADGLNVTADATDSADPDASVSYELVGGKAVRAAPHDFSYTWAGGGMMASAHGLATFGGRMLENRIVRKETFDAMVAPFKLNSGEAAGEDGYTVGFGWRAAKDGDGNPVVFHNGTTIGARSSLVLWRDEAVAATILSNASWISSIDLTTQMLAAPFRPRPERLIPAQCPVKATRYEGSFGGKAIAGAARFEVVKGLCRGQIANVGEIAKFFANSARPDAPKLSVVGLDSRAQLSRAGIVTPYGIYDLRAQSDSSFSASLSGDRKLELQLFD